MKRIPVYSPYFTGREKIYVAEAIDSGWISSRGEFITRFEAECARFIGIEPSRLTSVCNGTVALHLALLALDIKAGDEVIVPTFTYVASVNAIRYVGAVPVFCDSLAATWQVDPEAVRRAITPRTKAIMAVHLYGCPGDMLALTKIAATNNLMLIEDAAEAFGSRVHGLHVGTQSDAATFSFFGNKTITTGEGGLVTFRNPNIAAKAAHLKSQAASTEIRYWHDEIGYNYRMTNMAAAIGLAQIEAVEEILAKKRALALRYAENLACTALEFHSEPAGMTHSFWMVSALLPFGVDRAKFFDAMELKGVETRPAFYPAHILPMFKDFVDGTQNFPVATDLGARGFNLPSYPGISEEEFNRVVSAVKFAMGKAGRIM